MQIVRGRVDAALQDASAPTLSALRGRVHSEGGRLWAIVAPEIAGDPRGAGALYRATGLDSATCARILGFGHVQAMALADALETARRHRAEAAEAAALFNLGIALFDHLTDHPDAAARRLGDVVTPHTLAALSRAAQPLALTGDPALDPLLRLIGSFFARSAALGRREGATGSLRALIMRLYRAQLAASALMRGVVAADLGLLAELRDKSALPLLAMAHVMSLAEPDADRLAAAEGAIARLGEALWLADDLVDLAEDWEAGIWTRPWLLCALKCPDLKASTPLTAAVDILLASEVVSAEADELADRLLPRSPLPAGGDLQRTIAMSVRSWLATPAPGALARRPPGVSAA